MLAQVTLMGRLGGEPELRYTKSEQAQAVCSFSLAVQPFGQEKPDWWKVTCWGQQAEFAANHLAKGGRVLIVGSPRLEEWEDRNGAARANLACTARTLQAIDWAGDGQDEGGAAESPAPQAAPPAAARPARPIQRGRQ